MPVPRCLASVVAAAALLASVPATAIAEEEPARLLITYASPVGTDAALADAGLSGPFRTADVGPEQDPSRVQVLEVPTAATAAAVRQRLQGQDDVLAVEADPLLRLHADEAWGLDNRGQTVDGVAGRATVDIGAADAWAHATGRGVVVAVIDAEVDIAHPLLRDRIWRNDGERVSGRDDDGNGYPDDLYGWNFAEDVPNRPEDDGARHGTHVAGIIVGGSHSPTSFRGVAPDARVMALPFIGTDGGGRASDAIAAIRYAVENGADVINMSFGSEQSSLALRTAIAESGVTVVASAGNSGVPHEQTPIYPAAFELPNQLTVAAVDNTGALASYSASSRRTVHVAAPGTDIVSTFPGASLGFASGTSMAAPFVSGVVALAIESDPGASPEEIVDAVQRGVRPLPGTSETVTGGLARAGGTLASLGTPVPLCRTSVSSPFLDVGDDHVHRRGVACMAATGVTSGVTPQRYGAELGLTRAQVASLVERALRQAGDTTAVPTRGRFDDVAGSVHRDAIETLARIGIVRGVTTDTYAPGKVVSRAEFAAVVSRAAEHLAGAPTRLTGPGFQDVASSDERDGIETAAALSLVLGRAPGVFEPDAPVRRDQAATMLVRLLDRFHQQGFLDPR